MTMKAEVGSKYNAVIEQCAKNEQNNAIKMSMQVVIPHGSLHQIFSNKR